jgi:prepilin-type processing-associated H-X9-DG protein
MSPGHSNESQAGKADAYNEETQMKTLETRQGVTTNKVRGFTLIGLLVVIVTLAILAMMLLPTLARSKAQARQTICLNNMKQLMLTALLYADNNAGIWFPNQPSQDSWVNGYMEWNDGGFPWSSTNRQLLVTQRGSALANATGDFSFFAPYIQDPSVYKCPSDPSTADGGGPRTRSYSANQAVGTIWNTAGQCVIAGHPVTGQWLGGELNDCEGYGHVFQKVSQMNRPNPVNLFVFAEEHPDSINDSTLAVQIATTTVGGVYIDFPSDLHDGAGSFSFADGHAVAHRWLGPILGRAPFIQGGVSSSSFPISTVGSNAGDLRDLNWLQSHTSSPVNPNTRFPTPGN